MKSQFTTSIDLYTHNWCNYDLGKSVDCQDSKIRLRFGVIHQVQVNQFLQLQIISLHAVDHVCKQRTDIFSNSHASNDLLDGLLLALFLFTLQVKTELCQLTCKTKRYSYTDTYTHSTIQYSMCYSLTQ